MEDYLFLVHQMYSLKFHAFVLMPNHFHLLVTSPDNNLAAAMNYFMRETSKEMNRKSHKINQTYGGRYHRSLIESSLYFEKCHKYIYRNPVRANLTKKAEDYEFSTLNGICGKSRQCIPLLEDTLLFSPYFDQKALQRVNEPFEDGLEGEIRQGLKKSIFDIKRYRVPKKEPGT